MCYIGLYNEFIIHSAGYGESELLRPSGGQAIRVVCKPSLVLLQNKRTTTNIKWLLRTADNTTAGTPSRPFPVISHGGLQARHGKALLGSRIDGSLALGVSPGHSGQDPARATPRPLCVAQTPPGWNVRTGAFWRQCKKMLSYNHITSE